MDYIRDVAMIILFLIVIFLVIKIQKLSKNNIKENFSSDDLAKVRTEINKIYDMDVEAIRNLGHISKSLLTGTNYHSTAPGTPGDLTIPADNTKFKGKVSVDGGIRLENSSWGKAITGHPAADSIGHIVSDNQVHKKLMIVGNNSAGGVRKVGIWDRLDVHGDLHVDGTITIGSTTIRSDGSITIGRTTIDKDGNITYGSIKPHSNNQRVALGQRGDGVNDGHFTDTCPSGKTMVGLAGRSGDIVDNVNVLCQ